MGHHNTANTGAQQTRKALRVNLDEWKQKVKAATDWRPLSGAGTSRSRKAAAGVTWPGKHETAFGACSSA